MGSPDLMAWFDNHEHHMPMGVDREGRGPVNLNSPDIFTTVCFEGCHGVWPCAYMRQHPDEPNPPIGTTHDPA